MQFKKYTYIENLFILFVIFEIGIMIFSNAVFNNSNVIIYGNFAIEIIATLYAIFNDRIKLIMPNNDKILFFSFAISQLVMFLVTSIVNDTVFFDIHKLLMCLGMIYVCCYATRRVECTPEILNKIFNITLLLGIVATIYNMIINAEILRMRNLSEIMYYTWNFRSFFSARAAYGSFLAVCALIALLKSEQKKKKVLLVLYFWFAGNIILTAARAQCIALILGSIIYLVYSKNYRKYVDFGIFVGIFYLVIVGVNHLDEITETYFMFFDHSRGRDTDISTGRFQLWATALENMNVLNWFIGNGIGSKDTIMELRGVTILGERLSSFHSGYVDLLFETGILGLYIWGRSIKITIKQVSHACPKNLKHFFIATIIVVLTSCVFDSCYLIYTTDTMAMFASFFVIALPKTVANYYKSKESSCGEISV